jgi:lysozyme
MDKLIEMIKHHEGVVKHAYTDSRGYLTIGVGRLIDKELGGGLSDDEVDYLLANDLKRCQAEAETYGWFAGLNEPRQAVVISLLFNLGKPRFDGFKKAQAAIADGDFPTAAEELLDSRWSLQVGKRSEEMAAQLYSGEWA